MLKKKQKKIGEILLEKKLINMQQLSSALDEQKRSKASLGATIVKMGFISYRKLEETLSLEIEKNSAKKIGEITLDFKYINIEQLSKALAYKEQENIFLGEALVKLEYINNTQLINVLSAQFDIQTIDLNSFLFKPNILAIIPIDVAKRLNIIPLQKTNNNLIIAMSDPYNIASIKELTTIARMNIEPILVNPSIISSKIIQEMEKPITSKELTELSTKDPQLLEITKKTLHKIINQALSEGAIYIHLEPNQNGLNVRFRIEGELQVQTPIPKFQENNIILKLCEYSGIDINELKTNKILTSLFRIKNKESSINFKVTMFPVLSGFNKIQRKVTIKVLNIFSKINRLEDLGFYKPILNKYISLINQKNGVVLLAGSVDSGITSTLYTSLIKINTDTKNIATLERSIDAFISGVSQTQVSLNEKQSFSESLSSLLLEDTDILMISDIDDEHIANMIFSNANKEKLLLSSTNANNAVGAYYNLIKNTNLSENIINNLKGILAQKLVRRICTKCRETYIEDENILNAIKLKTGTSLYRGHGCLECGFTGFNGRVGIFELFIPDLEIIKEIKRGASEILIKKMAVEKGMYTLRMDGLKKVLEGITTLEQVIGGKI